MVYVSFFNLREQPFNLTPDPRFLFLSPQHEEALSNLLYGIQERKGFIEITGEVGTGKTLLCRTLVERLDETVSTAVIFNSYLTEIELLQAILKDFGLTCDRHTRQAYIDTLNQYLINEFAKGRNAVVIVDETQNVEPTVLEQLRLLSNLDTDTVKLLQVVLIGQPELRDKLATYQMRQLDQRIAVRYHLNALTRTDTQLYITHRMSVAGAANSVTYSRSAWHHIHRYCGGIPRRINLLCDRILLTAYVNDTQHVTATIVQKSIRDLNGLSPANAKPRQRSISRRASIAFGSFFGLGIAALVATLVFTYPYTALLHQLQRLRSPRPLTLTQLPSVPIPLSQPPHLAPRPVPRPIGTPNETQLAAAELKVIRTLWRLKTMTDTLAASTTPKPTLNPLIFLEQTAESFGIEVTPFNMGMLQLARLSRPCLIEVKTSPAASSTTLWVLVRVADDLVFIYQEPAGIISLSRQEFQQRWFGQLYLTLDTSQYHSPMLAPGMTGSRIQYLQTILQGLGYLPGATTGIFDTQTLQAVKAFQRDNGLIVDGRVGPRTLMMLFHVSGHLKAKMT